MNTSLLSGVWERDSHYARKSTKPLVFSVPLMERDSIPQTGLSNIFHKAPAVNLPRRKILLGGTRNRFQLAQKEWVTFAFLEAVSDFCPLSAGIL
jgi:hypothetical protein